MFVPFRIHFLEPRTETYLDGSVHAQTGNVLKKGNDAGPQASGRSQKMSRQTHVQKGGPSDRDT